MKLELCSPTERYLWGTTDGRDPSHRGGILRRADVKAIINEMESDKRRYSSKDRLAEDRKSRRLWPKRFWASKW